LHYGAGRWDQRAIADRVSSGGERARSGILIPYRPAGFGDQSARRITVTSNHELPMLPHYGVLIGKFVSASEHQGQWLHAILNLDVGGVPYQCAVDVNEPNLGFQYRIFSQMDPALFGPISGLPDGYHELGRNSSSGAMDYARSPILQQKLGCLAVVIAFLKALTGSAPAEWITVTGTEAGDALVAMAQSSTKLYVFGAPYTEGNGMHDVHCNQGDPAGSQWYQSNGIWQDGCVFAHMPDGTYSAYLGMFLNQTLNTDDNGNPR
jgi:hypothetical protein